MKNSPGFGLKEALVAIPLVLGVAAPVNAIADIAGSSARSCVSNPDSPKGISLREDQIAKINEYGGRVEYNNGGIVVITFDAWRDISNPNRKLVDYREWEKYFRDAIKGDFNIRSSGSNGLETYVLVDKSMEFHDDEIIGAKGMKRLEEEGINVHISRIPNLNILRSEGSVEADSERIKNSLRQVGITQDRGYDVVMKDGIGTLQGPPYVQIIVRRR